MAKIAWENTKSSIVLSDELTKWAFIEKPDVVQGDFIFTIDIDREVDGPQEYSWDPLSNMCSFLTSCRQMVQALDGDFKEMKSYILSNDNDVNMEEVYLRYFAYSEGWISSIFIKNLVKMKFSKTLLKWIFRPYYISWVAKHCSENVEVVMKIIVGFHLQSAKNIMKIFTYFGDNGKHRWLTENCANNIWNHLRNQEEIPDLLTPELLIWLRDGFVYEDMSKKRKRIEN